jgi:thiosulfate dehydrogenase [quinone] large subunit
MKLTGSQQFSLVTLRTAIGWHFAYEGFYKLMLPGWTRGGERIAAFSAEGYLRAATGPFASMFHSMASHPELTHAIDLAVPIGLLVVGLSLMLGLFTRIVTARWRPRAVLSIAAASRHADDGREGGN